jgi:uncharacterized protein
MTAQNLPLTILQETYAVCKLDCDSRIPEWASTGAFASVTRTSEELSIVCPQENVPAGVLSTRGWRCLRVDVALDFSMTGILESLVAPLARGRICSFAISTYNTDYLLVKEEQLEQAARFLSLEGHRIRGPGNNENNH